MDVQLKIPFETLVALVEQLPDSQQEALIQHLQTHLTGPSSAVIDKVMMFRSVQIAVEVNQDPSNRREDWYDDER